LEERPACPDPRQLLVDYNAGAEIVASATILLRDRTTKETLRARLAPEFPRYHAGALPIRMVGHDFAFDETPDGLSEHIVLRVEERPWNHHLLRSEQGFLRTRTAYLLIGRRSGSRPKLT
jgi:hypothetical protein